MEPKGARLMWTFASPIRDAIWFVFSGAAEDSSTEYGVDAVNEANEGSLDEFEIIVEVASSWIGEY